MSDQPEHPPVPFTARRSDSDPDPGRLIYDANQELVGWADECEMAQFIVRACNSHEQLLEACQAALATFAYQTGNRRDCVVCGRATPFPGAVYCSSTCSNTAGLPDVRQTLRTALAAAEGRGHDA